MSDRFLRVFVTLATVLTSSQTYASSCQDDDLQSKSNDGSYLFMLSGDVYEVLAGDVIDSSLWLPPSDVVICSRIVLYRGAKYTIYDIINKDENEKVSAIKRR